METTNAVVALHFEDARTQRMVHDLATLAGANATALASNGQANLASDILLLAQAGLRLPAGCRPKRLVRVGDTRIPGSPEAADVWLPGDGAELIAVVRDHIERSHESLPRTILVGSWHGGGGSSSTALAVAGALDGAVLDASASPSFPADQEQDGLDWDQVEVADMPSGGALASALPNARGVPVLTARLGSSPRPDDQRVAAAVEVLPCPAVIDCGTDLAGMAALWDRLLQSGQNTQALLVGRATDSHARACARALALLSPEEGGPSLTALSIGRESGLFRIAQDRFPVSWKRAPATRGKRRWKKVVATL